MMVFSFWENEWSLERKEKMMGGKWKASSHTLESLVEFIKPFIPNAPFLYPLKTSENRKVLKVF